MRNLSKAKQQLLSLAASSLTLSACVTTPSLENGKQFSLAKCIWRPLRCRAELDGSELW